MLRLVFALVGVTLLAVTALAVIWLAGQVLAGLGLVVAGTAGVLFKLLWFLIVAGVLGGLVYFVTSAWRPAGRGQGRAASPAPAKAAPPVIVATAAPLDTPAESPSTPGR